MTDSLSRPLLFCFGLHLHQPVGNFGYVFEQHVRDVYLPFLEHLRDREFFPVALHVSGPLLEWLEANDTRVLDRLGELANAGRVELLLAGFYEPILASLPPLDRVEQIQWLRDALIHRFGVRPTGLWLTERVWEPDLAADLHDAGVRFALVDDRHFLVSGFPRERLHAPFWTEQGGKRVALFPIDERLRYLVPFQPPEDTAAYLNGLRERGHRLAVLADDGEKFGGWPGTLEWVYERGWLDRFFTVMEGCVSRGEVALSTFDAALDQVPSGGIAYLPTASYREMEGWSLPAQPAMELQALEQHLGADRLSGVEGALVRGSHWRNFLVKYREANRMHKKMLALSALCRQRGNPPEARRAIGRAQCNDAYWHGVFGGLYLPFLRAAVWENLARAEAMLRAGEPVLCDETDINCDGANEVWVHSAAFSAVVSPSRGGAIEELSRFATARNLANALTRRREAYHIEAWREARASRSAAAQEPDSSVRAVSVATHRAVAAGAGEEQSDGSAAALSSESGPASTGAAPSIHDLEHAIRLDEMPPVDLDDRAIFVERVLDDGVTMESCRRADYDPRASAARIAMSATCRTGDAAVEIAMRAPDGRLEKRLTFSTDGTVRAEFTWDPTPFAAGDWFCTELSLDAPHELTTDTAATVWSYPIETVAKSEKGLDRTVQGVSYLVRWPVTAGRGVVTIPVTSSELGAQSSEV
jgi:alpha-amylase/alpha-mannosidase (GH57 family)